MSASFGYCLVELLNVVLIMVIWFFCGNLLLSQLDHPRQLSLTFQSRPYRSCASDLPAFCLFLGIRFVNELFA